MIRRATVDDLAPITDIYNHYIVESHVSFDLEPWTVDQRRAWFAKYGGETPWQVWVTELEGEILGAAWSSPFRPKAAYDSSVETTIVLKPGRSGRGLGTELYRTLLSDVDAHGAHRAVRDRCPTQRRVDCAASQAGLRVARRAARSRLQDGPILVDHAPRATGAAR